MVAWPTGSTATDVNGVFTASDVEPGPVTARITVPGFKSFETTFSVTDDETVTVLAELPDSMVRVVFRENALERKSVHDAVVRIGDETATALPDGAYTVESIPSVMTTLTVRALGRETTQCIVALVPGENSVELEVNLTAKETYKRYHKAYRSGRYKTAYKYLHPDVRTKKSYGDYRDEVGSGSVILFKIGEERIKEKWRSGATKRTYRDVTEIDRLLIERYDGRTCTSNGLQRWVDIDGRWFIVCD